MSDPRGGDGLLVQSCIDATRLETLLTDIVACYSPSFAEEPALEIVCAALEIAHLPYRLQPVGTGASGARANVLIELGDGPPELLLVGHIDTIPLVHDEELGARREGDLLFGLGSADMKSGCAAMIEALAAVRAAAVPLHRGVMMALVVGEEEYGDGSEALIREITAPLIVIGEPTGLAPCLTHHGYYEISLEVEGSRAHAAVPDVGANAIHAMLAWVQHIIERARTLPVADEVAINLRELTGGDSRFIVADRCGALLDVHVPAGTDPSLVRAAIEAARDLAHAGHEALNMDWRISYSGSGYAIDPEAPHIAPLREAFATIGRPFVPAAFRSHSDGNVFHAAGTSPVICGPGRLEAAHTRDEHVSMREVLDAARLYAALVHEACAKR